MEAYVTAVVKGKGGGGGANASARHINQSGDGEIGSVSAGLRAETAGKEED